VFDQHSVSFVSVTQQFNTTTSMGRLTLKVLLSFAQFEREVTGERIRDKIGASKRRGLWVGGMVPLGYVSRDKKLLVEQEEAERVRTIFRRYLDLGSIGLLLADLRERGIVTKVRQLSDGRTIGGIPFTRGPLAYLLRNRFYIGEVVFRDQICPAEHPPILDRDLFEAVQLKLAEQHNGYRAARAGSEALLAGRIFDDRGDRMSPSHAVRNCTRDEGGPLRVRPGLEPVSVREREFRREKVSRGQRRRPPFWRGRPISDERDRAIPCFRLQSTGKLKTIPTTPGNMICARLWPFGRDAIRGLRRVA
jgi:Recombinase/Resolvase, N terminal domain